jgi:hypothetical protein
MEMNLENNTIKGIHSWSNNEMLTSQLIKNKKNKALSKDYKRITNSSVSYYQ